MSYENSVLSVNPDGRTLLAAESALRENGFKALSALSPIEARFEIEMGRCGIFLASFITSAVIFQDLSKLFRQSCPDGLVIFVSQDPEARVSSADIVLSEEDSSSIAERIYSKRARS